MIKRRLQFADLELINYSPSRKRIIVNGTLLLQDILDFITDQHLNPYHLVLTVEDLFIEEATS